MLKTSCILIPNKNIETNIRISVMSRHTCSDGVTFDDRITSNLFDEHMPILAPPLKLIGNYYKHGMSWDKFEKEYNKYLDGIENVVREFAERCCNQDITILCIESEPDFCHRRLLANRCKLLVSELEIEIR